MEQLERIKYMEQILNEGTAAVAASDESLTACRALQKRLQELFDYYHSPQWLQDLEEIIIDPQRCPETAKEFSEYELERDKDGNFKSGFPDKNNHHIDAVRYACEADMKRQNVKFVR